MKCTSRPFKYILALSLIPVMALAGCGAEKIAYPYSEYAQETTYGDGNLFSNAELSGFAKELAILEGDITDRYELPHASSGLLADLGKREIVFAKDPFEKKYPASITKLMTAYVAMKYSKLDEIITCTRSVSNLGVPDAVAYGLVEGDTLTMDQALRMMLVASYNDVSVAVAEHVSGSIASFCDLMNEEALKLGATGTHFTNPHGLHDDEHYTTAYDLYLIFNEITGNPDLMDMIQSTSYNTVIHDKAGKERQVSANSTNHFFRGTYDMPDSVTILGGKTGTTDEAGYCLTLYVKDNYSNPYIAVILDSQSREMLYLEMSELLSVLSN